MVGARRAHVERLRGYGLGRVEVVLFPPEEEAWLRDFLTGLEHGFSFHAPLFRQETYEEYPLKMAVLDPVPERRARALAMMRRELDTAAAWGAQHLVVHLQRNLLMDQEEAPAGWGEREGVALGVDSVGELLAYSRQVGVPVHLENMMGSPLLHSPEAWGALAAQVPEARFCVDVGHAALDARYFGFPEAELAAALGSQVASLHVYDNQLPAIFSYAGLRESGLLKKYPVHAEHLGEPGWIDTLGCLRAALAANRDALVTFEVYYDLDTDRAHTAEGLAWLQELLGRGR
jgi:sugar phosphate isomerase/epimerase